jgi:hypothetical protein
MSSESLLDTLSRDLARAVFEGNADMALRVQKTMWQAGGALHQVVSPLLAPALACVSTASDRPPLHAAAYVALASLSPRLRSEQGPFVARRFLESILGSPRLGLSATALHSGANVVARGVSRDPLEGYLRALADGQWRRALQLGLTAAKQHSVDAVLGASQEVAAAELDLMGFKLVAQRALCRLAPCVDENPESLAGIVALTVELMSVPGAPHAPEQGADAPGVAEVLRTLVEAGGPGAALVPVAAAAADTMPSFEPDLELHVREQLAWLGRRFAPEPTQFEAGSSSEGAGLSVAFSRGSDSIAHASLLAYLGSRGITDDLLTGLLVYSLEVDERPPAPLPFLLVSAVADLAQSAERDAALKGLAERAAVQVWRAARLAHRQWGTTPSDAGRVPAGT